MKTQTVSQTFLYRYEAWGNYTQDESIILRKFAIRKETPCGFWILDEKIDKKKWIGKNTYRPYAYKTPEEALKSFAVRKTRYLGYLQTKMNSTIKCLEELKRKIENPSISGELIDCQIWKS